MSITVVETSFDLLLQSITAPARSRSNTSQSLPPTGKEQHGTTQGVVDARQEISQTELRRASNTSSVGKSTAAPGGNTTANWRSRSRSGSVASSASSGKLAFTGMLRHGLPRTSNINSHTVQEQPQPGGTGTTPAAAPIVGDRPFPMARRVTGAQKTAGCVLSADAQVTGNVQGVTPAGLPVWWCHFDNMVVFDGMLKDGDSGDWIPMTRSSKGLPVSNRHGDDESVLLDLQCEHCKTVLGLQKWRYSTKVCTRSVCAGCKVRCRQEYFRMMKQGHCFNHFEKVSSRDGSKDAVLERIPDAEISSNVLAPAAGRISHEPAKDQPKFERPATPVAHLTDAVSEVLAPVNEQGPAVVIETLAPQELQTAPKSGMKDRRTSSISALYFEDNELQPVDIIKKAVEDAAASEAVVSSPAPHSAEDIGLAITVDEAHPSPIDRRSPSPPQLASSPLPASEPTHVEAEGENNRSPAEEPVQAQQPTVETTSLAERRGTASSLTITLPEDCHQDISAEGQNEQQVDSPQSEHPETPTFEMCEPGPIIEDIMSPKFAEEGYAEEEFDISMMIRNLDTDEVTALPATH